LIENHLEHNHSDTANCKDDKPIKLSPLGYIVKLFAKWFGFTSLYSAFSVCPFCGQPGCPVGIGSASIIGAFFALVFNDWRILIRFIKTKFNKRCQT
jgi:hypothetical protein